jgi:predicted lysophospholipase L1 biosynthesis ABC-type transport system permease subunit
VELGDRVKASGPGGTRTFRVVGQAVFPPLDDNAVLAEGAAFTREGLASVVPKGALGNDSYTRYVVRWTREVDAAAAARRVASAAGEPADRPRLPAEIDHLTQLDALPYLLAGFLALLSTLAVGHALVTSVRRRRRDFAILETLGFVRRQVWAMVAWQASTLAVFGLLVGIPLGIVLGRVVWGIVAGGLGVATDAATPALSALLVVPVALVLANAIAAFPARAAARTRPAVVLRSE